MMFKLINLLIMSLMVSIPFLGCAEKEPTALPVRSTPKAKAIEQSQTPAATNDIAWIKNFEQARKESKDRDKPLIVDFYANWCIWCKIMDQKTFSTDSVKAFADKFIWAKVDTDKEQKLASEYKTPGLPYIVFIAPNGTILHRVIGYKNEAEFVETMKKALSLFGKE